MSYHQTAEHKQKIVATRRKNNSYVQTQETKQKIKQTLAGRPQSPELIAKRVATRKKNNTYFHTEKTKQILRKKAIEQFKNGVPEEILEKNRGSNNANWKGGAEKRKERYYLRKIQKEEKIAGRKRPVYCEICLTPENKLQRNLCFDHDHSSGLFRGWICCRCNMVLGHVKDDEKLLIELSRYLIKHKKHEQRS
jgi:hypothetical protein